MTTLENRPNSALLVIDVQNGVVEGAHERDAVVANVGSLVEKARRERVPIVWVQHSDEQLARGSDDWLIVPELTPGDSSSSAHRPMRASARRSTARSSGGTTRPWSATPTRRRTRRHGGRRRRTRSSRTRTCTGPTRRRRGGRPGQSRPRMSTSAARPEACATRTGTPPDGTGSGSSGLGERCPQDGWPSPAGRPGPPAYRHVFTSNAERATALAPWLQSYNTCRHHSALGGPPTDQPPVTNEAEYI